MTKRDQVRGVGLLCCHCVRNVAYYLGGWKDGGFVSHDGFWRNTNNNFLDIAILEWRKVFADWDGEHHWRTVVPEPDGFLPSLFEGIGITESEFNARLEDTKTYWDKFVTHLDSEHMMQLPRLDALVDSSVFLYDLLRNEYQEFLTDAPENLRECYELRLKHGRDT